jgi:glycosyltransferase involved in cell wall biosynthesis
MIPRYINDNLPEPDVIHAGHIYLDGYGILPYRRSQDLPMTAIAHGWALNNYEDHRRSIRCKIDAVLNECDRLLCVSETLLEQVQEISPETPASVVPLGADPDRFPTESSPAFRRAKGIDPEETLVLFCGQFIKRKGIPLLIDAIREADLEQTQFVFVGHSGKRKYTVLELASSSDNVSVFEGMENEELAKWFAAADLFVLPSYSEGRPTVLYEAMASQTAVLATSVGGVPEQVVDSTTGLLVPPGDGDALRRTLEDMTADRSRLQEMGQNGYRRLVSKGWTWEDHAARLYEIHTSLIQDTGKKPSS